eukprot:TRINITY_DN7308_c0_g1_i1.p1 TRINITY_DN7308_c0_g1~~TRINITY_DN7308_c0_g1_i1.p1  ORF type:complete len:402 (+),score=53.89 TRINITY_DN7308_c0_g1_i1:39-1244(+)
MQAGNRFRQVRAYKIAPVQLPLEKAKPRTVSFKIEANAGKKWHDIVRFDDLKGRGDGDAAEHLRDVFVTGRSTKVLTSEWDNELQCLRAAKCELGEKVYEVGVEVSYAQRKSYLMKALHDEMRIACIVPTVRVYQLTFKFYSRKADLVSFKSHLAAFRIHYPHLASTDQTLYVSSLILLSRLPKDSVERSKQGLAIWRYMTSSNIPIPPFGYAALIKCCSSKEEALSIMTLMQESSVTVVAIHYEAVLASFRYSGTIPEARKYLLSCPVISLGMLDTFAELHDQLSHHCDVPYIRSVIALYNRHNHAPTARSFTILLKWILSFSTAPESLYNTLAKKLFARTIERGLATMHVISVLLNHYCSTGDRKSAVEVYDYMIRSNKTAHADVLQKARHFIGVKSQR